MGKRQPPDWSPGDEGIPPRQYIANGKEGMTAVYKYFRFQGTKSISVTVRGSANGRLLLKLAPDSEAAGVVAVTPPLRSGQSTAEPLIFRTVTMPSASAIRERENWIFWSFPLNEND